MRPFSRRFPWLTVALAALYASVWFFPAEALEYDRTRVAAGEAWRLLTGQLVHWTPRMAAFDIGMLLGLGAWLEAREDRGLMITGLALGGGLTALAVHTLSPGLQVYRGGSGVASALFVLAAVRIAESPDPRLRTLATAAVALFLGKAAFEAFAGQTLFAGPLPQGVHVVPLVHLLGGLGGLVTAPPGSSARLLEPGSRPSSN
ncbi:MAG: rhomboid family intramembrane serine protease [Thermoanaerobaculia bacterium]